MDSVIHKELVFLSDTYINTCFVIISGPSCGGKTTISKKIEKVVPACKLLIKHTDRAKRSGENNNEDYYFVDTNSFVKKQESKSFIVAVNRYGHKYALAFNEIDSALNINKIPTFILDPDAALEFKKIYNNSITIFVAPHDIGIVQQRIRNRDDSEQDKNERLKYLSHEYNFRKHFDIDYFGEDDDELFFNIKMLLERKGKKWF